MYRTTYRSVELVVGPAYWPALGLCVALAFAQSILAPLIAFRGGVPSLVTIAVVLYANRVGARRGAQLGLPAGLALDIFAGTPGGWTVAMTVTALAVGGLSHRFFADGAFLPALHLWRPDRVVARTRCKRSTKGLSNSLSMR